MAAKFELTEEGKNIEAYLPDANCNRCAHFKVCGIIRTVAQVEQNGMPIKLDVFMKHLPRICPLYSVTVEPST
jgi:hypothetical protein